MRHKGFLIWSIFKHNTKFNYKRKQLSRCIIIQKCFAIQTVFLIAVLVYQQLYLTDYAKTKQNSTVLYDKFLSRFFQEFWEEKSIESCFFFIGRH